MDEGAQALDRRRRFRLITQSSTTPAPHTFRFDPPPCDLRLRARVASAPVSSESLRGMTAPSKAEGATTTCTSLLLLLLRALLLMPLRELLLLLLPHLQIPASDAAST
jgi:hypothetical protein